MSEPRKIVGSSFLVGNPKPRKIVGYAFSMGLPKPSMKQKDPKKGDYVKDKAEFMEEAVNAALSKAKESGEFDGKDGRDGKDGTDGQDGKTPVKGVDYFDGTNGRDGTDGKDGTSPVVSVSAITGGHRITITDANGKKTVDVMDGEPGNDGYTPVKGKDYDDGKDGQPGENGRDGNGIKSVVLNSDYTLTLTFDNGTSYTTPSIRGATGATGPAYTLTSSDRATIVNDVIAALPVYNGEVI